MDLQESLDRIMQKETAFGTNFYKHFFEIVPDAKSFFADIDWRHQELSLTMALSVLVRHHDRGYPATRMYLEHLGTKHHDRSIPTSLFENWRQALIETLRELEGEHWNPELEASWLSAYEDAVEAMMRGYTERHSV
jgi:hemoglobin-like flavoprotein